MSSVLTGIGVWRPVSHIDSVRSMAERIPPTGRHVRQFIRNRGDLLLERLGETPFPGADWLQASHGAVMRVKGDHDELFERLLLVLPRPTEASVDRFRAWAETRLEHLAWYLEACNTGRRVSTVAHDLSVVAVFMIRVGRDPQDPRTELPPPAELPELLRAFVFNLERYVHNLGDDELRYVRALRIYRIPHVKIADEFVLNVDILPTVIGLAEPTVAIHPLTLVRGVIGELAELLDQRREELRSTLSPVRVAEWARGRSLVDQMGRTLALLDELCAWIDQERPPLSAVRQRLAQASTPRRSDQSRALTVAFVICAGVAAGAWWMINR